MRQGYDKNVTGMWHRCPQNFCFWSKTLQQCVINQCLLLKKCHAINFSFQFSYFFNLKIKANTHANSDLVLYSLFSASWDCSFTYKTLRKSYMDDKHFVKNQKIKKTATGFNKYWQKLISSCIIFYFNLQLYSVITDKANQTIHMSSNIS